MIILEDSLEQHPLPFKRNVATYRTCLKSLYLEGDYACQFDCGYIPPVVFERKSLEDLFNSIRGNNKAHKAKIKRAQERGLQFILIVEETLSKVRGTDLYQGRPVGKVKIRNKNWIARGTSIVRAVFTDYVKHGVPVVWCEGREDMACYINEFYFALEKEHNRRLKQGDK